MKYSIVACLSILCSITSLYDTICADFITKWEFVKLCKFAYDPETDVRMFALSSEPGGVSFDPQKVQPYDCIFLRGRHASTFFKEVVPSITVPFIIIAHGEYKDGFQQSYLGFLDEPNLVAWFGTHPCSVEHPKFHPIPLGVKMTKKQYQQKSIHKKLFAELQKRKKSRLIYANFSSFTHPIREKLNNHLKNQTFCTYRSTKIPFKEYLEEMGQHHFTFSPRGFALDCYRTWEALYAGSIPVVLHSSLDYLYEGLPILFVDNWQEVDEAFLTTKYKEMASQKYDLRKLSMDYWIEKIRSVIPPHFSILSSSSERLVGS